MTVKRVEVPDRATIVLALTGYAEALRVAPGGLVPRNIKPSDEIARVSRLVDDFTNKFLYLSDKLLDESGRTLGQAESEQPALVVPAKQLQPGRVLHLTSTCDVCGSNNPHADNCPHAPRTLASDLREDR